MSQPWMDRIPWTLRSVLAGSAGTAALSGAYAVERAARRSPRSTPLDYDDSDVPGRIVVNILHLGQVSEREDRELATALRWSYGSLFGLLHGVMRRRVREPGASVGFAATLLAMTFSLFPLLGRTPPPWRWSRGYVVTCLFTHTAYVAAVGVVDDALRDQS
ncbi:MAG TPA: hypothetical protein VFN48_03730 [Solirubrobacteraceae bacterium]|nr:hypothetical protein [Solirubrobacteraceae bacterium]